MAKPRSSQPVPSLFIKPCMLSLFQHKCPKGNLKRTELPPSPCTDTRPNDGPQASCRPGGALFLQNWQPKPSNACLRRLALCLDPAAARPFKPAALARDSGVESGRCGPRPFRPPGLAIRGGESGRCGPRRLDVRPCSPRPPGGGAAAAAGPAVRPGVGIRREVRPFGSFGPNRDSSGGAAARPWARIRWELDKIQPMEASTTPGHLAPGRDAAEVRTFSRSAEWPKWPWPARGADVSPRARMRNTCGRWAVWP